MKKFKVCENVTYDDPEKEYIIIGMYIDCLCGVFDNHDSYDKKTLGELDKYAEAIGLRDYWIVRDKFMANHAMWKEKRRSWKRVSERDYQDEIESNFKKYFPGYTLTGREVPVRGVGVADFVAVDDISNRPAVIETKLKNMNPAKQLLAYSYEMDNPILIGITERPMNESIMVAGIEYYTYEDLGISIRKSVQEE